jgi:hypothetical protein
MSARSLAAGTFLAAVAPAFVASGYVTALGGVELMPLVLVSALVVSLGHVLFLGVPTVFILRHFGMLRTSSLLLAGGVLGMVPFGVLSWPVTSPPHSSFHYISGEMVATLVNGVPTAAGWAQYAKGIAFFGFLGAIGGGAFALALRVFEPNYAFKRTAGRGHRVS